jgi:hypothetical protein
MCRRLCCNSDMNVATDPYRIGGLCLPVMQVVLYDTKSIDPEIANIELSSEIYCIGKDR